MGVINMKRLLLLLILLQTFICNVPIIAAGQTPEFGILNIGFVRLADTDKTSKYHNLSLGHESISQLVTDEVKLSITNNTNVVIAASIPRSVRRSESYSIPETEIVNLHPAIPASRLQAVIDGRRSPLNSWRKFVFVVRAKTNPTLWRIVEIETQEVHYLDLDRVAGCRPTENVFSFTGRIITPPKTEWIYRLETLTMRKESYPGFDTH